MAILNIWIFPIFISIYSIISLLICVLLSVYSKHIPSHWPYLSDFTKYVPARNAFTIMTNHILLLLLIWMYLKHRELKSYFRQTNSSPFYEKISFCNFIIGILAITSFQLAVNFPISKVNHIEEYGNKLSLAFSLLYLWIHSFLSLNIRDENLPSSLIFIVRISLASVVISCCAAMIQASRNPVSARKNDGLSAIYEWCCYFSSSAFLLTDAYEFKFMVFRSPKLIIRGCIGYDERVFESSDVSDEEEITPPMSQRYVM